MNQEHAFALAIEKLLNVEVPLRGQYIRVLFAELDVFKPPNVTTTAMDVGAMTPIMGF